MRVDIHWRKLRDWSHDPSWEQRCVLYAYYSPLEELVYIGKADLCSVAQRSTLSAKGELWERYAEETGHEEWFAAIGELELPEDRHFSSLLLSNIESLLIYETEPLLNRQCITTRTPRPGLVVCCQGYWPQEERFYED
jgi:hypothetical protein